MKPQTAAALGARRFLRLRIPAAAKNSAAAKSPNGIHANGNGKAKPGTGNFFVKLNGDALVGGQPVSQERLEVILARDTAIVDKITQLEAIATDPVTPLDASQLPQQIAKIMEGYPAAELTQLATTVQDIPGLAEVCVAELEAVRALGVAEYTAVETVLEAKKANSSAAALKAPEQLPAAMPQIIPAASVSAVEAPKATGARKAEHRVFRADKRLREGVRTARRAFLAHLGENLPDTRSLDAVMDRIAASGKPIGRREAWQRADAARNAGVPGKEEAWQHAARTERATVTAQVEEIWIRRRPEPVDVSHLNRGVERFLVSGNPADIDVTLSHQAERFIAADEGWMSRAVRRPVTRKAHKPQPRLK